MKSQTTFPRLHSPRILIIVIFVLLFIFYSALATSDNGSGGADTNSQISDSPTTENAVQLPGEVQPQGPNETPPDTSADTTEQAHTDTSTINTSGSNNISRAQFTTAVVGHEPADNIVTLSNNNDRIYFFTELANLKGSTITHRWEYDGKIMAEVNFNIGGNRWRVYSSKSIKPEWTGTWTVAILDENGQIIKQDQIEIVSEANANQ